jgi:hypothetical protein
MILLKLGLLSCAFYVALTTLLAAGFLALVHVKGSVGIAFGQERWFRTPGLKFGVVLGRCG